MAYFAVRFSKKTGKIDTTLSNEYGSAMLEMWGLLNTTAKSKDTMVFDSEGNVIVYYEGTGDFPKVYKDKGDKVDNYCPGLLQAILEINK